jgi:hypothetical protein
MKDTKSDKLLSSLVLTPFLILLTNSSVFAIGTFSFGQSIVKGTEMKLISGVDLFGRFILDNDQSKKIATVGAPIVVKTKYANGYVNLREKPDTKSRIIAPVPNGTILAICTQCESTQIFKDKHGNTWYRVFWESRKLSGWIEGVYLVLPKN